MRCTRNEVRVLRVLKLINNNSNNNNKLRRPLRVSVRRIHSLALLAVEPVQVMNIDKLLK